MSIDALSWAFNLDLPNSGIKLTLLALANYANEENRTAYPSQKTISQKTCLSTRAIRSHLVALEELGVISRESRKRDDGTFTSDLFTLNVGFSPPKDTGRNYRRQNLPSAKNDQDQRQNLPSPAAEFAGHEPNLTSTKAKGEPKGSKALAPKKSGAPKEKSEAVTNEAWAAYNTAYFNRYGTEMIETGKTRGQMMTFLKRVGREDAPHIAAFYVSLNNKYYIQNQHTLGALVSDAEALRTQWITGRTMTSARAAQIDSTATNANAVNEAIEMLRRRNGNAAI